MKILSSPYSHGPNQLTRVMLKTTAAAIPGWLALVWLFGPGVVVNLVIVTLVAYASEALMLLLRRRPLSTMSDGSALLTAVLLAASLPPYTPWWLAAMGAAVAIIVGKQIYGGLGSNLFNPAMVGFVTLIISFPLEMTQWAAPLAQLDHAPSFGDALAYALHGAFPGGSLDAISMATPLDHLKTELTQGMPVHEILDSGKQYMMSLPATFWPALAWLLGGLYLLQQRIITWQIPAAMLSGIGGMALIFWLINPAEYASPAFHLVAGASMIGAFFIATDPVTSSTTPMGKIWFGLGCGVLTWIIRTWGGYPDGVAFSVLLMNMAAPAIDYFTKPKVYGH
ncbi:MAG: electron transport complex subunit RsxD [Gammaproteobacteria bacterium]|nr:MAG: electron transport complex subunit RsxD [Gammaproteobacteria bacterium]